MKPAPFDYHRAVDLGDAVETLAATEGEGKIIAGGQSLVPLLAMRLAQPTVLVDLQDVPGLTGFELSAGALRVGSMTRHRDLVTQRDHPMAAEVAPWIGHTAIRTRGTVGGSIAHADPNAELPALAVACDASVHAHGPVGARTIGADDLFEGMLQTTLADDEILTAVSFRQPQRWGFAEMARRHGDFAMVLSMVTEIDGRWRVVIGGVGSTPIRCAEAEEALADGRPADDVGRLVTNSIEAYDDLHAAKNYRQAMAGELTRQAIEAALIRGEQGNQR